MVKKIYFNNLKKNQSYTDSIKVTDVSIKKFSSASGDRNPIHLNEKLIELSSFMFWFAFFISIFLFSYSEEIIEILYGGEFAPSTNIFNVQIFTVPLAFLGPVGTRWLIIKGYVDIELYKTLAAATLNVALNYLFIREFGAIAATYTSILSYLVANIFFFVIFSKTRIFLRVLLRSLNIKNAYVFFGYIIKKVK